MLRSRPPARTSQCRGEPLESEPRERVRHAVRAEPGRVVAEHDAAVAALAERPHDRVHGRQRRRRRVARAATLVADTGGLVERLVAQARDAARDAERAVRPVERMPPTVTRARARRARSVVGRRVRPGAQARVRTWRRTKRKRGPQLNPRQGARPVGRYNAPATPTVASAGTAPAAALRMRAAGVVADGGVSRSSPSSAVGPHATTPVHGAPHVHARDFGVGTSPRACRRARPPRRRARSRRAAAGSRTAARVQRLGASPRSPPHATTTRPAPRRRRRRAAAAVAVVGASASAAPRAGVPRDRAHARRGGPPRRSRPRAARTRRREPRVGDGFTEDVQRARAVARSRAPARARRAVEQPAFARGLAARGARGALGLARGRRRRRRDVARARAAARRAPPTPRRSGPRPPRGTRARSCRARRPRRCTRCPCCPTTRPRTGAATPRRAGTASRARPSARAARRTRRRRRRRRSRRRSRMSGGVRPRARAARRRGRCHTSSLCQFQP